MPIDTDTNKVAFHPALTDVKRLVDRSLGLVAEDLSRKGFSEADIGVVQGCIKQRVLREWAAYAIDLYSSAIVSSDSFSDDDIPSDDDQLNFFREAFEQTEGANH